MVGEWDDLLVESHFDIFDACLAHSTIFSRWTPTFFADSKVPHVVQLSHPHRWALRVLEAPLRHRRVALRHLPQALRAQRRLQGAKPFQVLRPGQGYQQGLGTEGRTWGYTNLPIHINPPRRWGADFWQISMMLVGCCSNFNWNLSGWGWNKINKDGGGANLASLK